VDALAKPIERVVEATEYFVRTPSLRLMHVATSNLLRNVILQHICATELLDANTAPFFVLEAPTEIGDDGWALRAIELRADWEELAVGAPPGSVKPLWPEQQGKAPLARFGLELGSALKVLPARATGLIIVLAPVWIRDAARFREDLSALLAERALSTARFIVVEEEAVEVRPLVERLGAAAEHIDARVDAAALRDEMNARLEAMKTTPPGATGPQLIGAAGPPVTPPTRKNAVPKLSAAEREAQAAALGIAPVLLDLDAMSELRILVIGAAGSMRDGQAPEAVRQQREARDFCERHGLHREAVVNELVLAGYVLQGGSPDRALGVFSDAKARALTHELTDLAVQAQMAMGSCLLVLKRSDDAATAYAEAGQLGANHGSPIIAIEAYRMCGQLLASKGRLEEAGTAFRRALDTAAHGGQEVTRNSTALEAARELAKLCRKHGLAAQADSLEAQAAAIEASLLAPPTDTHV